MYSLLADSIVFLHALFVLFVVVGQVLILAGWIMRWCWTRNFIFRICHLAAIGYVVAEVWFGIICPLTILEHNLRIRAGESPEEMSFIGYWLNRLLFYTAPDRVFTLVYTVFALLVIATFVLYPPMKCRKQK
jgi:hypothetical protein